MHRLWFSVLVFASLAPLIAQSNDARQSPANPSQSPGPTSSSAGSAASGNSPSKPADSTRLIVIKAVEPTYPETAKGKQLQGRVWGHLTIDESGNVVAAEPISGDPILLAAAIDAMEQWKFQPYIKDGHPIRASVKMHYDFAFTGRIYDKAISSDGKSLADVSSAGKSEPVQVSQLVAQGNLVHQVAPVYPNRARQNLVQGTVVLHAVIGKDGSIRDLKEVSSPSKDLTDAAMAAVEQWRYKPYVHDGQVVEVDTTIHVNFKLR